MRLQGFRAIAIPRQAGDVPQPCRTGCGWDSENKPQASESFLIQQFFKNAGEVQGE